MKKIINKIINIGYQLILIFTILCFFISLVGATFFYVNRSFNYLNPFVLIIGSILYLLLISKLYIYLTKRTDKTKKILSVVLLVFHFILLFISSQIIRSVPQVDLIHILTEINHLNENGTILNNDYFSVYPNNRFLLMTLYIIQKIPIDNHILFGFISSLSIVVMSLFTYKTVSQVFDINKGLLSLFICVFSPIWYLYVSYYYTDILMLPFASILVYLMVQVKDNNDTKVNILYGILIGVLSVIGYKIRAVCIFILIAYILYLFVVKKVSILKKLIPIMIGLFLMLICVKAMETNFFKDIDENKEFPITHWIMMGVNETKNGYYNQDDYILSKETKDVNDRIQLNLEVIKERLSNQGVWKTGKLLVSKLVTVWGKGDYSYQKYLELVSEYNIFYHYLIEDKNIVLNYLLQFSKIAMLILCICSLFHLLKSNEKSFIAIALFGAVIFYLIWEVCPRYGLSFLPWMILLSSYSYDSFSRFIEKRKENIYIKYILVIVTVILFIIGFNKYTEVTFKNDMVAKTTTNKVKYISLNHDTVMTQSMKLNSTFNTIKLKFKCHPSETDSILKLEVLDDKKEVVYDQFFGLDDITDDGYITFQLDKAYSKGNYFIELSSMNGNDVEVYVSYKQQYDYYKDGTLEINSKEEAGDLMFEVCYTHERATYTYVEYIAIIIISLGIEYILLFRKKDE